MKTSTTNLIAILATGAALLAANTASAGHGFSFGGGNGGGFKVSFGGNNHNNHSNHNDHHDNHHHHTFYKNYHYPRYYAQPAYVAPCVHPLHSCCYVYPGDTWSSISLREYGKPNYGYSIAAFNGLSTRIRLVVGQKLLLPVIQPTGQLTASAAPASEPFYLPTYGAGEALGAEPAASGGGTRMPTNTSETSTPSTGMAGTPESTTPSDNSNQAASDRQSVPAGSQLVFNGQSLGAAKGTVRLRMGEMTLPVTVLEWTDAAVKIELPPMALANAMDADLEIMRADGSVASTSAIQLTPAASGLAQTN
jgi:hypothetical protein